MALSDMQVFSDFVYSSATETVRQQIDLFNAASQNTIVLRTGANVGDYANQISYQLINGLVRRRNAYGSGSISNVPLKQHTHIGVKVAGGTVEVLFEPQQFTWIQRNPEESGVVIGEQLARGMLQDQVNTAILSLKAAFNNNAAVKHDATAGKLNLKALTRAAGLFGDRMGDIRAWVIHSKPMTDLFENALTNSEDLFRFETVRIVQDGFGRVFVMTDAPPLYDDNSTSSTGDDTYFTLGLATTAAEIEDNADLYTHLEERNGEENIIRSWQAEWTYNLGLKGYAWDKTNGGNSPSDTALGTGSNWDQLAADIKDTAGVLIESQ